MSPTTDKAAGACLPCPGATPTGRSKAARSVGRCGAMNAPPGRSSPVSSKITTPLQSRLQPCSGWLTMVCAASRSGAEGGGQGGVCGHISVPVAVHRASFRLVLVSAAHAAIRRFQSTLVAARRKWPIRTRPITRTDYLETAQEMSADRRRTSTGFLASVCPGLCCPWPQAQQTRSALLTIA